MAKYTHSTRTRPMAKGNKCTNKLGKPQDADLMLTCYVEISALNRYAPPRISLLCSKLSFFLDNSRTIWEAQGQKQYRWERRKGIPDGWWLFAVIAYGVIMHWAG